LLLVHRRGRDRVPRRPRHDVAATLTVTPTPTRALHGTAPPGQARHVHPPGVPATARSADLSGPTPPRGRFGAPGRGGDGCPADRSAVGVAGSAPGHVPLAVPPTRRRRPVDEIGRAS